MLRKKNIVVILIEKKSLENYLSYNSLISLIIYTS